MRRPAIIVRVEDSEFQSTHPRGVRPGNAATASSATTLFQSTHPRGVRQEDKEYRGRVQVSFNPRTRVGCDTRASCPTTSYAVFQSTHPRGVRLGETALENYKDVVSIHAPAWGATLGRIRNGPAKTVSIHAPAWGATCIQHACAAVRVCFNPRTRVGCDAAKMRLVGGEVMFQSTHPRGVRHAKGQVLSEIQYLFQSTHPRGVRPPGLP